jgi:protein phosphatase
MKFEVTSYSDKGPRKVNEDAWNYHLFNKDTAAVCIADGVGGNPCGHIASKICTDKFISYLKAKRLDFEGIIRAIDKDLKEHSLINPECAKMSSTLTGCILSRDKLLGVHVGDTRIFILRGDGIQQLTQDHTELNRLIQEQKLHPDDVPFYTRKNVLEMALGSERILVPAMFEFNLAVGDRILLTTDGIHDIIRKVTLRDISLASDNLVSFANKLIKKIGESKVKDNVTFVAVQVNY